jgi:hypothetical protein
LSYAGKTIAISSGRSLSIAIDAKIMSAIKDSQSAATTQTTAGVLVDVICFVSK